MDLRSMRDQIQRIMQMLKTMVKDLSRQSEISRSTNQASRTLALDSTSNIKTEGEVQIVNIVRSRKNALETVKSTLIAGYPQDTSRTNLTN